MKQNNRNIQLLKMNKDALILFMAALIISIYITNNDILRLEGKSKKDTYTLEIFNRCFAIIILLIFLYTSYESYKIAKSNNKYNETFTMQIIVAVLSLIANRIGTMDVESMQSLLIVLITAFVATFFHSFVTTAGINAVLGRVNPLPFLKKFMPAWLIGFSTQSSTGAIPANVEAQTKMGVPDSVASFAASIGSTFGIVMFTINAMNINYGITDYLQLIIICLLVSAGTAGVPGVATIVATSVMTALGLPVEMVILMTPISAIVDMGRTATNVKAAGSAGLVVAAQTDALDKELYYA